MADRTLKENLIARQKINEEIQKEINFTEKLAFSKSSIEQSEERIVQLEQKKLDIIKEEASLKQTGFNLAKSLEEIKDGALGKLLEQLDLEKQIHHIEGLRQEGTQDQLDGANKYAKLLVGIQNGSVDLAEINRQIAEEGDGVTANFGEMLPYVIGIRDTLEKTPDLAEKLKIGTEIKAGIEKVQESLGMIDLKKTFSIAGIAAGFASFVKQTLEVKQSFGTTAVESARIAGNISTASITAKAFGGSSQEAEAAVKGMVEEFGTLNVLSFGTSLQLGKMVATTGISGANAAKLLKSMESISTASISTNIAQIETTAELARAAGVAPAKVLNDIASSTETFAQFAKDGGSNIASAAIEAAKLGLNLSTVAGAAEKLLNFESSIQSEMEAQMLIGRSLNLDKARELALAGDLAGVAEEIKSQVGSQAEFEAMNVVQRKALADAMGVNVTDLAKIIAGEKTSAELEEEKAAKKEKHMDMMTKMSMLQLGLQTQQSVQAALIARREAGGATASIFKSLAKFPFGVGLLAAGGIVAGMYALMSKAPGLETGGKVKESGLAEVHRGEVFSGTNDEMGMSNKETNSILKELLAQNEVLMKKLTNEVSEMKLA